MHAISPLVPPTTCQWCGASIPIRGPACPACVRFGTPGYTTEQIDAVVAGLKPSHRKALLRFEMRHSYGPTLPLGVEPALKPRLAKLGILRSETHRGGGPKWYGLSVLGEKLRERLSEADAPTLSPNNPKGAGAA
jgi:hypothetical protein